MTRRRWVLLIATALAFAAGCSGSTAPQPPPTKESGPATIHAKQQLAPLRVGENPLWTGPESWTSRLLHKDGVIGSWAGRGEHQRLAVFDAATGRTRWTIDTDRPVPGSSGMELSLVDDPQVVDLGSGWYVLVKYVIPPCPSMMCDRMSTRASEQGVVALSGVDGSVKWKTRLAPAYAYPPGNEPDRHPEVSLRAVSPRIAVATLDPRDGNESRERAVGLDPVTGRIRWRADELWPVQVVGDTIVGDDRTDPGRAEKTVPSGRVAAFAAGTGKKRWSAPYPVSGIETVAGDAVLVDTVDRRGSFRWTRRILDIRDGTQRFSLPDKNIDDCVSDGATLIACLRQSGKHGDVTEHLLTYHVHERTLTVSRASVEDDYLRLVGAWKGRIYFETGESSGGLNSESCHALDAAARPVGADLPGVPDVIGDAFAMLDSFDGDSWTIRRVAA
ncbi:MAG TPA: PQQ-binding-like beta-propeller repeat protein [Mycobacteriales bacterium]|nr:PQQ-binding-like beta-propeller repeat protein [Mycobacteriales bacterium]